MVSVIIPSRNEPFLQQTIQSLLDNATGEIEIIAVLDGYWPNPQLINDSRLILIHTGKVKGMRGVINAGVAVAHGEYILKCDAHCMFDKAYDSVLSSDCENNWIVVPRRYRLDPYEWKLQDVKKPPVDYEYLTYPNN